VNASVALSVESSPKLKSNARVTSVSKLVGLSRLTRSLSGKEQKIIGDALYGKGPPDERLVENKTNFVQRQSMETLRPKKWLNDEVINWYFHLIGMRSRRWCYVFNSFFIPKLLQELHKDPAKAGQYDYKAVKKWTKSGDIFSKDKLLFPIHVGRQHWIWVMVDRLKKKIQVFDSGSQSQHRKYLEAFL